MNTLILFLALAGGTHSTAPLTFSAAAAGQTACPPANPRARAIVERFLTSEGESAARTEFGMATVQAGNLRLLTDSTDAAICNQLRVMVPLRTQTRYPEIDTYFVADGFYFVATTRDVPEDQLYISWLPLLILKRQLKDWRFVGAVAM